MAYGSYRAKRPAAARDAHVTIYLQQFLTRDQAACDITEQL